MLVRPYLLLHNVGTFSKQGILYRSASKPVLVQDTNYMVEKTYYIAPYLGTFMSYLMPQCPIYGSKGIFKYKNDRWNVAVNSRYLPSVQKVISFGQKRPK